jgi:Thiamine pyrophosphate enzyme, N-terminal TPP binding domain
MFERYLIQWAYAKTWPGALSSLKASGRCVANATELFRMALRKSESILEGGQYIPKVTGNNLVVQTLKHEGIDTVFHLTGGPMSDVAGLCLEMRFTSIDVRHEPATARMAYAYSHLTGTPGIGFAASGPGTTNLLTGLGNSFLDATPLTPANLLILSILYRTNT